MRYRGYLFDVQGTLLDFFTPVRAAVGEYLAATGRDVALAADLTRAWRANYFRRTAALRQSVDAWTRVQQQYAEGFAEVCDDAGLPAPDPGDAERVAAAWQRLVPWPDVRTGIARIRRDAVVGTLSNTDTSTMIGLSKALSIDWDVVLTAEVFGAFKPDPVVYRRAVRYLGMSPGEVALVASHPYDLRAAAEVGLGTVFVFRPAEYGDPAVAHDDAAGEFGQRVATLADVE